MKYARQQATAAILTLALLAQACGGGFAQDLRTALSLAPALIDSLVQAGVIKPEQRATYIRDFEDLAAGAAILKEGLDNCAKADTLCRLGVVEHFQHLFWDVQRRGHFGTSPKLQNIEAILRGIIDAARVYYGAGTGRTVVTESDIKTRIEALKIAMKAK